MEANGPICGRIFGNSTGVDLPPMPYTDREATGGNAPCQPRVAIPPDANIVLWMPTKHMGNLLLSLKAIARLEDYFQGRELALVIDEAYREIIEAAGLRSRPVFFPRQRLKQRATAGRLTTGLDFLSAVRRQRPAVAIVLEGEQISRFYAPLSGSRLIVGPANRFGRRFHVRIPLDHGESHKFWDYATVTRAITGRGIAPGYAPMQPPARALAKVDRILARELPEPEAPVAVIHPGATKEYKRWPVAYFADVARTLHRRGLNVVITGAGPGDGEIVERLRTLCDVPCVNLHNRLSLPELTALYQHARFFLGNDTGPTHLAAACDLATFAIFGPSDDAIWGPLGESARILRSATPCHPDCSTKQCFADYRCMSSLTPDHVLEQLAELLPE